MLAQLIFKARATARHAAQADARSSIIAIKFFSPQFVVKITRTYNRRTRSLYERGIYGRPLVQPRYKRAAPYQNCSP